MATISTPQNYTQATISSSPIIPISFASRIVDTGINSFLSQTNTQIPITPITSTQVGYRYPSFQGGSVRITSGMNITDSGNTINLGADSTIEMWLWADEYPTTGYIPILAKRANTSTSPPDWLFLYYDTNGYLTLQVSSSSVGGAWGLSVTGTQSITPGRWNHIAIVRQSTSTWTVYLNGNLYLTGTSSGALNNNTTTLVIGSADSTRAAIGSFGLLQGYVTGIRINTTTAVYTSAFTNNFSQSPGLTQSANTYGSPTVAISSGTVFLLNPVYGTTLSDSTGTSRTFTGGTVNWLTPVEGTRISTQDFRNQTSSVIPINNIVPFSTVITGGQTVTEQWI